MTQNHQLPIDQDRLVDAWKRTLPMMLNGTDSVEVKKDGRNPAALIVTIETAGRSKYALDFKVTYVDEREVKVDLLDVEQEHRSVDERTEIVQTLAEDYVRHIHECAQQLHELTSG